MTGIDSWSTTPATNATADGGAVNWAENQPSSTVNNTARQQTADIRAAFNDLAWFQYGSGDQGAGNIAVPCVYASGTSFTIAGVDVTAAFHIGRRVRAVGSGTGTIYGRISNTAFSTNTTVTVVWDSGSLTNETLVISLSQIPVTGTPVPQKILEAGTTSATGGAAVFAQLLSLALTPGKWRLSATATYSGAVNATCQIVIGTTTASSAGGVLGKSFTVFAIDSGSNTGGGAISPFDVTISSNTTYYLNGKLTTNSDVVNSYFRAELIG